ncbi:hypothetical protein Dsin_023967 [Dipteronia sinensis]|uniref:Uncharacterized protein n=1 Tax=Dipteronia sinensis TaxID=43782 RepID=A0AAE0A547_9ROSI|nr:hypothetical protein Dsin_023967 [Dipteronia sinensis]
MNNYYNTQQLQTSKQSIARMGSAVLNKALSSFITFLLISFLFNIPHPIVVGAIAVHGSTPPPAKHTDYKQAK